MILPVTHSLPPILQIPLSKNEIFITTRPLAAAAALSISRFAHAASPALVKNIVLVHGFFADGSGWQAVAKILTRDGYKVSVVQQPETSFEDDVKATNRVIDAQDGPSIS
jgi:triacylglycerol esterase/lipase EstA (alpha/beta hydrolase family)